MRERALETQKTAGCSSPLQGTSLSECPDTFSVSPTPGGRTLDNLPHTVCSERIRFTGVPVDIEIVTPRGHAPKR